MFKIKIGDKLRVDEVKVSGRKIKETYIGRVIEEYEHHFSLQGVNYLFSLNKNALIDRSLQVKRIRGKLV